MVRFPLNDGHVLILDQEDAVDFDPSRWAARTSNGKTYVRSRVRGGLPTLHRVLMNPPADMVVDHINGNPLDNRRSNLRICTRRDNLRNKRAVGDRVYKGVYARDDRFRAAVVVDGVQIPGGSFATVHEAAAAYDIVAAKHHGEFACLNFKRDRDWLFPFAIADAAGRINNGVSA